jgi:hypothetical protein
VPQDARVKILRKTGIRKNGKQHAGGCEYIHIEANGDKLTLYHKAGLHTELSNEFITVRNGKPPWWTQVFVRTDREIEQHYDVRCGILAAEFPDKHPRDWTKQGLITLDDATEVDMVEAMAEFHC